MSKGACPVVMGEVPVLNRMFVNFKGRGFRDRGVITDLYYAFYYRSVGFFWLFVSNKNSVLTLTPTSNLLTLVHKSDRLVESNVVPRTRKAHWPTYVIIYLLVSHCPCCVSRVLKLPVV